MVQELPVRAGRLMYDKQVWLLKNAPLVAGYGLGAE